MQRRFIILSSIVLSMLIMVGGLTVAQAADDVILHQFSTINTVASTVPVNGDINPYGVARVMKSVGNLTAGHILVSNFNNSGNLQGTGTTIVDVAPNGSAKLFAQLAANSLPGLCPGGVGLTTALVALRAGWVVVGSLPTTDGTAATAQAGCLIVLDNMGNPVETFYGSLINGPWDMTASEDEHEAQLFVTNVLNGTVAANGQIVNQGTVVRLNLKLPKTGMPWLESMTVIGSGFPERTDPAALVIGPTGVGLSPSDRKLYVADSLNNRITVIPDALDRTTSAGTGQMLSAGGSLNDPLGLVVAPNNHILTVNGNDGFIIEITPQGRQIVRTLLDNTGSPPGAGTLFGLTFDPKVGVYFVDDGTNTLNLLH
jgi:DNA-binding beta-propeller fold protein YncE